MKIINKIAVLGLSLGMLMSVSSCVVLLDKKHDNGKHKGHHKNWPRHNKKNKGTVIIIEDNHGSNGSHQGNQGKKGKNNKNHNNKK